MIAGDLKKYWPNFSHLRIAISYAYKASPKFTKLRGSLVVLQALIPLIPLYLIKLLIDELAIPESSNYSILSIILCFGLVQMVLIVINNISAYCEQIHTRKISNYVTQIVAKKALRSEFKHFEDAEKYNYLFRAKSKATSVPGHIIRNLIDLSKHLFTLVCLVGFLVTMDWIILVILVFSVIPFAISKIFFARKKWELDFKNTLTWRKVGYANYLLTNPYTVKELKISGYGKHILLKLKNHLEELVFEIKRLALQQTKSSTVVKSIEVLALLSILYIISQQTIDKTITIGSMVMFYQGFLRAQQVQSNLVVAYSSIFENRLFFSDFVEFLKMSEQNFNTESLNIENTNNNKSGHSIEITNLYFKYPTAKHWILSGINLTLPQRGFITITGSNGSGKSSLLKLMASLYSPNKGHIKIENQALSPDLIEENCSFFFQRHNRYEFSILENVIASDLAHPIDYQRVDKVLSEVDMLDFINNLDKGLDTKLSNTFDKGGILLSGGQWQRIAIARALYKRASIYIFDEPTNSIDPENEIVVLNSLLNLAVTDLVIVVTHKAYLIEKADRVLHLKDGKIMDKISTKLHMKMV